MIIYFCKKCQSVYSKTAIKHRYSTGTVITKDLRAFSVTDQFAVCPACQDDVICILRKSKELPAIRVTH
ncbi:MAG: hypothetical protein IT569_07450 [Leptospiraceae bacterium]|nr:hypothetical protein [Leptospiraceae bacterium]